MKAIGKYQNRKIYWFDYLDFKTEQLPTSDWVCFATSDINPNNIRFDQFVRHSIDNGILEFKGHGKFGEMLHDIFDETMVDIEITEKVDFINVMTTWHDDETYADTFWQCFFATCLPETADLDNVSIVCTDLKGTDRSGELKEIIERFENGWIPD